MKPSEIARGPVPAEEPNAWTLPYPASSLAEPAITHTEARAADTSICVFHNGLIRETGDVPGRVFLCPVGRAYWRYQPRANDGMYATLSYGPTNII